MKDDHFEWDDNKAKANERKHGVSFEEAREAFRDNLATRMPDDREFYDEDRFTLIGMAIAGMLTVTFTHRNGRIRIVSARKAERHERRRYFARSPRTGR